MTRFTSPRSLARYRQNTVIGVVDDPGRAQALMTRLLELKVHLNRCQLLQGETGLIALDRDGRHHGAFARATRFIQGMTGDREIVERYAQELMRGHCVLTVSVRGGQDDLVKLRDVFRETQGHDVNCYGPLVTETLVK